MAFLHSVYFFVYKLIRCFLFFLTAGTISGEEIPIVSKTNIKEYRDSFSCEKFSFQSNPNITFYVYVSNFTWPIKIQVRVYYDRVLLLYIHFQLVHLAFYCKVKLFCIFKRESISWMWLLRFTLTKTNVYRKILAPWYGNQLFSYVLGLVHVLWSIKLNQFLSGNVLRCQMPWRRTWNDRTGVMCRLMLSFKGKTFVDFALQLLWWKMFAVFIACNQTERQIHVDLHR